jgi:signal transduction histidine kinase
VGGALTLGDDLHRDSNQAMRQRFYEIVTELNATDPEGIFVQLCSAWREVMHANAAWLWVYNDYWKALELAGSSSDAPESLLPRHTRLECDSAAKCALDASAAVHIRQDLDTWSESLEGRTYKVTHARELEKLGFQSVTCVPFLTPASAPSVSAAADMRIQGSVVLLYRDPQPLAAQPNSSLLLMGKLTAQVIANSFLAKQRAILVELNGMAQRHLTAMSRPATVRQEYLNDLIKLIRNQLHFLAVSVFYRQPFEDGVECLATTGLQRMDGRRVEDKELIDVVYKAGEGRTGTVYRQSKPHVFSAENLPVTGKGKYNEVLPGSNELARPAVFHHIPASLDNQEGDTRALGVIRCAGHQADSPGQHWFTFHPIDIQTLGFIVQQIAPVLLTLENRLQRERIISVIKHDLYAPINMVRDTVETVAFEIAHQRPPGEYALQNLSVSALIMSNLVAQLDPEPGERLEYDPQPYYIEGDILARVANMLRHFAWMENRMRIEFENIRNIPKLRIDRDLVERCLVNLLVNAVKYGDRDTTIMVKARSSRGGYALDVINSGMGVEADELPHIFKPNYRSPRARNKAMGLGFGLTIAEKAMERHGGKLFLTQAKNPTIFSMFFPKNLAADQSLR